MSLSISSQNSYLKKPLGQRTESNQNAGSSRTQVAQNLQSGSAGATRTVTLSPKKHSRFVAGQGNLDSRAARMSSKRLQDVNKRTTQGSYDTERNDYGTKQSTAERNESIWFQSQYSNYSFGQMTGNGTFNMNGMAGMNQTGAMGMLNKIGGKLGIDAGTINTIGAIYNGAQQVGNIIGFNPTQQLTSVLGSLGGSHSTSSAVSANAKAAISSMSSADDAVSLKLAIEGAKAEQTSLAQTAGQVDAKQTALTSATNDKKEAETKVSNKKQDVATKNQTVQALESKVPLIKSQLNVASNNVSMCNISYQKALQELSLASPEGKAAAQEAVNNAKAALEKAKSEEAQIQKALTDTENQLSQAKTELNTAKDELQQAEQDLTAKDEALEKAQTELDKAKQAKQDYDTLSNEIKSQEARLDQLDQKEKEEYSNTTKDIKDREAKIGDKTDDKKLAKLKAKQKEHGDNIIKLQCLSDAPSEIGVNGEELRSVILPSGGKAYFVGTQEVKSEEEYNKYRKQS